MARSSGKKTDNVSLASKVALRRWLLERMHLDTVTVLDTCAGAGHVWTAMEEHVRILSWVRCDIKPRQGGTLAMTATQAVKSLPLDAFNVIDIDPYGEPWEPYREVLRRLKAPTAIFLTHGHVMQAGSSKANLAAVGIPADWPIPINPSVSAFVAEHCLRQTWHHAAIDHAARVMLARVSYYALAVRPLAQENDRG